MKAAVLVCKAGSRPDGLAVAGGDALVPLFGRGSYRSPRSCQWELIPIEMLVKTGKAERISSVLTAIMLSDVAKTSGGSGCQHYCACRGCTGWICVPEQDEFSSEKMLMQMYKVTIQRRSLGCIRVDCLQQKRFTCYWQRPAQLQMLPRRINEHHNWRTMENLTDRIIYLKAGLVIP